MLEYLISELNLNVEFSLTYGGHGMLSRVFHMTNTFKVTTGAAFSLALLLSAVPADAQSTTTLQERYEQAEALRLGTNGKTDLDQARKLHSELVASGYGQSLVRLADIEERQGNYQTAIDLYNDAISAGSTYAIYRLISGHVESGFGALSEPEKGFSQLEELSQQTENKQVRFLFSQALEEGLGTTPDPVRAMQVLKQLGAEGHGRSLAKLGNLAMQAPGLPADYGPTISYYQRAADAGYDYALIGLSRALLADGQGAAALRTIEQAVEKGVRTAPSRMAIWHYQGDFGEASDKAFGRRELTRLAESGDVLAARAALINHERRSRRITELDLPKVLAGLESATKDGDRLATVSLARAYRNLSFLIPDARAKHAALVAEYGDQMGVRSEVPERLHALYDRNNHRNSRKKAYEFLQQVEGEGFAYGLLRLRSIERTAYVYVLQKELADLGYYDGSATGFLTKRTILAIFDYCDEFGMSDTCIHGPISYDTASIMVKSLAEQRENGS